MTIMSPQILAQVMPGNKRSIKRELIEMVSSLQMIFVSKNIFFNKSVAETGLQSLIISNFTVK